VKVRCDHWNKPRCPWPECPHKKPHEKGEDGITLFGGDCDPDGCVNDMQEIIYKTTRCVPVKKP
jgi:hypothetical protein